MREDEYHQLELERMQRLEEALNRAEAGFATPNDWQTIRFECGMPHRKYQVKLHNPTVGELHESKSVR